MLLLCILMAEVISTALSPFHSLATSSIAGHVGGPDGNPFQREAGSATALRTAEGTLQLGTESTVRDGQGHMSNGCVSENGIHGNIW